MRKRFVLVSVLASIVGAVVACSSSNSVITDQVTGPDAAAAARDGMDGGDGNAGGDGGSCSLLASSFDRSCQTDSNCVLVPRGGNTCDTCNNVEGALFCDFDVISADAAAPYLAALRALATPQADNCTNGSCPGLPITATCVRGTCVSNACAQAGGICVAMTDAGAAGSTEDPYPCAPGERCENPAPSDAGVLEADASDANP